MALCQYLTLSLRLEQRCQHVRTRTHAGTVKTLTVWCQIRGIWVIWKWVFYLVLVITSKNYG